MRTLFTDIGLVTGGMRSHLARLASIENDSPDGGGSTSTIEDEETDEEREEREARERDSRDEDPDDEDLRGRRGRDAAAYRELQSDRDKLRNELETQKRENQEFRERLTRIESEKSEREKTNERSNDAQERARLRAREVTEAISKIDPNDPDRAVKIYTEMYRPLYEEMPTMAEEASERNTRKTITQERTLEMQKAQAREATIQALKKAGLEEDDFELVQALAISKQQLDPGWFTRIKPENQIPELVEQVKGRIVKTKRNSKEFQEDRDRHRRPMSGVIEGGSRGTRRQEANDDDNEPEGPGSMLDDIRRAKDAKRHSTKSMLRQAEFGR